MSNKRQLTKDTQDANKPRSKSHPFSKDVIFDPAGQWKYPGKVTRIPGGNITMKNVNYPVLGVDDIGVSQVMLPEQDYQFPGASFVTEYPMMQKGGNTVVPKHPYFQNNKTAYVDSVLSANQHLDWVRRLHEPNTPSIPDPNDPKGTRRSTHLMSDDGQGYVFPAVVNTKDGLKYLGDKAEDYARETNTGIQLPKDEGTWFAANGYKQGTNVLKGYQKGGSYQDLELDDAEIAEYQKRGYRVEFQKGGSTKKRYDSKGQSLGDVSLNYRQTSFEDEEKRGLNLEYKKVFPNALMGVKGNIASNPNMPSSVGVGFDTGTNAGVMDNKTPVLVGMESYVGLSNANNKVTPYYSAYGHLGKQLYNPKHRNKELGSINGGIGWGFNQPDIQPVLNKKEYEKGSSDIYGNLYGDINLYKGLSATAKAQVAYNTGREKWSPTLEAGLKYSIPNMYDLSRSFKKKPKYNSKNYGNTRFLKEGGESQELELTDAEIAYYKKLGYHIEVLD